MRQFKNSFPIDPSKSALVETYKWASANTLHKMEISRCRIKYCSRSQHAVPLFKPSKPSCLLVSAWGERKRLFFSTLISQEILWKHPDKALLEYSWSKKWIQLWRWSSKSSLFLCKKTGCWRAKVPPRMFHLYALWNVYWRWRQLHTCWAHQAILVR